MSQASSASTQAEAQTGKAKSGRKVAACVQCRAVKQKCDAASRLPLPCRRCELYGLECEFEPGRPSTTPGGRVTSTTLAASPSSFSPNGTATGKAVKESAAIAVALREMTERLARIEMGMDRERRRARGEIDNYEDDELSSLSNPSCMSPSTARNDAPAGIDGSREANPVAVIEGTFDEVEQFASESGSPAPWPSPGSINAASSPPLDAVVRGLVSAADAQAAFNFYHDRIEPWIWTPSDYRDNSALAIHSRSPFLFHVILLVTAYFNPSTSPQSQEVYLALTAIVNELLGRHIMCPDPSQSEEDLLRALGILLLYRPIQHAAFMARGLVSDPIKAEQTSKVNSVAAGMIHALINQTARVCNLAAAPADFTKALIQGERPDLARLRLWYRCVSDDIHGSLQGGISTALDITDALRTTRQFAALKRHPRDTRHAAMVELYAILRAPDNAKVGESRYRDIPRVNIALDKWEQHWRPLLADAQMMGDGLAYTVVTSLRHFCTITVNSPIFHRWQSQRSRSLADNGDGRPSLTDTDWLHLQKAVDACQKTIFSLSLESLEGGMPLRSQKWPSAESSGGYRQPLHLDPSVVQAYSTGMDTLSCVIFVFPLLLLVKMASAGLISCELQALRSDYEAGCDLSTPQPLTTGRKLPRLLELGASFLDAVAPRPSHPAKKHALLLRLILQAGLREKTPASPSGFPLPFDSPASLLRSNIDRRTSAETSPSHSPRPSGPLPVNVDGWLWNMTQLQQQQPTAAAPVPGEAMSQLLLDVDPFLFSTFNAQFPGVGDQQQGMEVPMVDWDALQNGSGWGLPDGQ